MIFKLFLIAIHSIKSTFFRLSIKPVSTLIITHIFILLADNIWIYIVSITIRLTNIILIEVVGYDLIIDYEDVTFLSALIHFTLDWSPVLITNTGLETDFFPINLFPLVSTAIRSAEVLLIFIYFYKWFFSWNTGWDTCIIEDIVVSWSVTLWDTDWVLNVFVCGIWEATDDTFVCLRVNWC